MSLLPWGDWIYDNGHRRDEVRSLHKEAVALAATVKTEIDQFNTGLTPAKNLIAGNAVLLVIANTVVMNDLEYDKFRTQVKALPPPAPGSVPAEIGSMLSELAAGTLILKAVLQVGRLGSRLLTGGAQAGGEFGGDIGGEAVSSLGEAASEVGLESGAETAAEITGETVGEAVTEAAAEAVIEGASLAGLAETGIGIFAAVGIDVVFGLLDGAKEKAELDRAISKLHSALKKAQFFYNTVLTRHGRLDLVVGTEENRFTGLVTGLAKVTGKPAPVPTDLPLAVGAAGRYSTAMAAAADAYGDFLALRDGWVDYVGRHPAARKDDFVSAYIGFARPGVARETISAEWDVLAAYSEGMRART
ncbi:hypothetical protein [Pseudonocardia sp. TRM90224]|uniref:hypothetical protein n=1 Tax=Pseudonocardia sp. TRM90224 TaxID=2812678 RepID=UPI001E437248|nr:hypothetical protein [Pseudonocardia sp. TRM90224]